MRDMTLLEGQISRMFLAKNSCQFNDLNSLAIAWYVSRGFKLQSMCKSIGIKISIFPIPSMVERKHVQAFGLKFDENMWSLLLIETEGWK